MPHDAFSHFFVFFAKISVLFSTSSLFKKRFFLRESALLFGRKVLKICLESMPVELSLCYFCLRMMIFYTFSQKEYNLRLAIVFNFIKVLTCGKNRTP
jgi:hypothetical protein